MTEIIGKIAVLLGIGRNGKFSRERKRPGRPPRKNDTITISSEARRLLADTRDEEALTDDGKGI